ncbi:MAG: hypothetical protein ABI818_15565 [Acidobacteriota bacterium]
MRAVALAVLVAATIGLADRASPPRRRTDANLALEFLKSNFSLSASDLGDLSGDRPVSRSLDPTDRREVATLGVIRLRVPAAFYLDQLRQIADFKRNPSVLQIGVFGLPARVENLRELTLESGDVESLRRCHPGSCNLQLSSDAIGRFQREIARPDPNHAAVTNRVIREILVDLVNGYRTSGDDALMTYGDAKEPLSVAREFREMIRSRPAFLERFPLLEQHLEQFPRAARTDVDDTIYWSKEKLGPRVVLSVTHLAIARLSGQAPALFAAASKQIYSSHYFDASLGLTVLLADGAADAPSSYLVYINRSRIDALGGVFGGLKRIIVRSRTRSAMASTLEEARARVEQRFRDDQRKSPAG